jgi:hypothetical protein
MSQSLRHKIMVGAIVGVVLACGAVAAVAATGPSSGHRDAHPRLAADRGVRRHGRLAKTSRARRRAAFVARNYLGLPAATYLGLSAAQLQSELQSGKTLAQVAGETSGRSEAGLIEALVKARKERLAAAVTAGLVKQAQASAREAAVTKRITALVNRRFSAAGSG